MKDNRTPPDQQDNEAMWIGKEKRRIAGKGMEKGRFDSTGNSNICFVLFTPQFLGGEISTSYISMHSISKTKGCELTGVVGRGAGACP